MARWDDVQAGMKVKVKGVVWDIVGRSGATIVMKNGATRREGKPNLLSSVEIVKGAPAPQPTPAAPAKRRRGLRDFSTPDEARSPLEPTPQPFTEGVDTDPTKMESDWSRVYPGYNVKGKDGFAWRVVERTKDETGLKFKLARPGREPIERYAKGKVTLVFVDKISDAEATARLVEELGAEVLAERVGRDPILRIPPAPVKVGPKRTLDYWKTHMKMLHGIYGDDLKSVAAIMELHESEEALTLGSVIPHVHA